LFDLLRRMNSRAMARECAEACGTPPNDVVPLLHAVADETCGEVTVGLVAQRLAIDPSRASRAVAAAIEAGYVTRLASQADGRRSVLALTEAGNKILNEAERFRRDWFDRVMGDWPAGDRVQFARLLTAFVEGLHNPRA
jgi:DNA-binding MarR family transcriptional regulator